MPAPFSDLQSKLEAASKAVAETVSLSNRGGAVVHTGLASDQLALPFIVISAQPGEEFPQDSGNFFVASTVEVYSSADPKTSASLTSHRSRSAYVFDVFMGGTLAADLSSAVSDFTVLGIRNRQFIAERQEERHWVSGLQLDAYCCATDLT